MPIYVAAGSILLMGKVIKNTTQAQTDLTLYVYVGKTELFPCTKMKTQITIMKKVLSPLSTSRTMAQTKYLVLAIEKVISKA